MVKKYIFQHPTTPLALLINVIWVQSPHRTNEFNMAGISSGQILRLKEVFNLGTRLDGKSVRTWGR